MIAVKRDRVQTPAVLTEKSGRAERERIRAAKFFLTPKEQRTGTLTFHVYKDNAVKDALEKLFNRKCAYCESRYTATQPLDIDHWRPKSDVDLAPWETCLDFPGYYWLASDWDNLLPSCIDCNRRRSQITLPADSLQAAGKGTAFPIYEPTARARSYKELASEQPLLLNPCVDEPSEHLEVHRDDESVIAAKSGSRRGAASINVYGLNRVGLVLARRERLFVIRHHLYQLTRLMELHATVRDSKVFLVEELIQRELEILANMRSPSESYAFMSRALIDGYLGEVLGITFSMSR